MAADRFKESGLPYIVVLTNPTTGGVTASYAMLGDVHIAEPGALIGFAGPRVIEQTIREKLPEGFQRAEYLMEHGMVDMVVSRLQMKGPQPERLLQIEGGALQAVYLERDGTRIELIYYPEAGHQTHDAPRPMNRVGFTHLSLRVADLDAIVAAIVQAGGSYLEQSRIDNPAWHSKAVFVTDPDGLRIELIQAPGDPNALPGQSQGNKENKP